MLDALPTEMTVLLTANADTELLSRRRGRGQSCLTVMTITGMMIFEATGRAS